MSYLIEVERQTSTGHRLPMHDGGRGKCARLHGHTYKFEVSLTTESLDEAGFSVDYGKVKDAIDDWDHRLLLWEHDAIFIDSHHVDANVENIEAALGVIRVPFEPTAENMAAHLARRFVTEFEPVIFALVIVHESDATSAQFSATPQEAKRDLSEPILRVIP